jgi:HSP20 family protein
MVRRFHRSIYDELDELRASMDYLYQLALEPADYPLLPEGKNPEIICRSLRNLNAEVAEYKDEVTVTVDTVPGAGDSKISIDLIDENTLTITCNRDEERKDDGNRNRRCEQQSFSLHHRIQLPCPVKSADARIRRKNGVLDIHLKKAPLQWRQNQ